MKTILLFLVSIFFISCSRIESENIEPLKENKFLIDSLDSVGKYFYENDKLKFIYVMDNKYEYKYDNDKIVQIKIFKGTDLVSTEDFFYENGKLSYSIEEYVYIMHSKSKYSYKFITDKHVQCNVQSWNYSILYFEDSFVADLYFDENKNLVKYSQPYQGIVNSNRYEATYTYDNKPNIYRYIKGFNYFYYRLTSYYDSSYGNNNRTKEIGNIIMKDGTAQSERILQWNMKYDNDNTPLNIDYNSHFYNPIEIIQNGSNKIYTHKL